MSCFTPEQAPLNPRPLPSIPTPMNPPKVLMVGSGKYTTDFIEAAAAVKAGTTTAEDCRNLLATDADTAPVTAILEAGRRSLDEARTIAIGYDADGIPASLD